MRKTIRKGSARSTSRNRSHSRGQFANDDPRFKDINPGPPRGRPPTADATGGRKPDQTRRNGAQYADGSSYPEAMPANPVMRTRGEDSISTERVTLSVRMRFNPLRGLTPERLVQYLEQFWIGFFRMAAITWDKMEQRNSTLKSVVPKRKKAVSRHGYEILIVDDVPPNMEAEAQAQKEALTYFFNNLTATDAVKPDEQGGLSLLARQMMDAQCKYYAVHEIVWQPSPDGLTAQFVFCPLWWFEGVTGKLRYLDNEFQVYGRDMLVGEWLVTCGEGLMEAASVCYIFLSLTLNDWLGYCEKFGQPFIDASTSASPGSAEWEALKSYVQDFGPDGGGVRSDSATINLVEPKSSSNRTFESMVAHMRTEMITLFRGGDLGTNSKKNAVGANLQEDESTILEDDDCIMVEETLATKVSRFVITWARGADVPVLAYLKFNRSDKENTESDLKVDQFLLDAGAPIETRRTLERYGRPCPKSVKEGDLLKPKQQLATMPDPESPEAKIANEADTADFADLLHEMLLPLIKRLEAIAQIDDAAIQQHMVEKLLKDYPQISAAIQSDNSLAKKLSPVLENSLVAGTKEKAKA